MSVHHCHFPGCTRAVPPAKWGCYPHWMSLPQDLRARLWKEYVPGQEIAKTPTRAYLDVANEIQRWILKNHTNAKPGEVFVFGSNLSGRHGQGAAKYAMEHHGAIYGRAVGIQGHSYAIPTKDDRLQTLPVDAISRYVEDFLVFARKNPEMKFKVTAIGCGLAGYRPSQIAPLFAETPSNCALPDEFSVVLGAKLAPSSSPVPKPRRQACLF